MLLIEGRLLVGPIKQTVYPTFARAGVDWREGSDLYHHRNGLYRYSPLVAASLAPFSFLPERAGEVLWRLLNVGVYLGAFLWWARTCLPRNLWREQMAALLLLMLPLSIGSLNNGQSNALVLGLLLAGLAAAARERWNWAAVALALAAYFKIYPLAIGLLLAAVYPRQLGWRLSVALAVGAAVPFALQRPEYVAGQYASWLHYLLSDTRIDVAVSGACRDLRLLLRVCHIPVNPRIYMGVQLLAALGAAGLCIAGRRAGWPQRRLLTSLFGWGCCWMLLLGPATESCTYILLAPSLAWAVLETCLEPMPLGGRLLLGGCIVCLALALVANWFPFATAIHALGVQPLGALFFVGYLASNDFRRLSSRSRQALGDRPSSGEFDYETEIFRAAS